MSSTDGAERTPWSTPELTYRGKVDEILKGDEGSCVTSDDDDCEDD